MEPQDKRASALRGPLWLAAAGFLPFAVLAMGCHAAIRHVDGIESVEDKENVCVDWAVTEDPPPTSIEFFGARNLIADILEDDTLGWESASPKIDFWVDTGDCDTLAMNDRTEREIEYRIGNQSDWGPCPVPCWRRDETTAVVHGEWTDYTKSWVYLAYPDLTDGYLGASPTHIINHETGHAIGLRDAVQGAGVGHEYCVVNYNGLLVWNVSIMHNALQCADEVRVANSPLPAANVLWPSAFDIEFAKFSTEKP